MSKEPYTLPADDDDLPPPYSPTSSSTTHMPSSPSPSLFSSHLTQLNTRLRSQQAIQLSTQDASDDRILSLLMPHVEATLSSIASLHPPPSMVETTFVPAEAVGTEWLFSERDELLRGEIRTFVRVGEDRKLKGDEKGRRVEEVPMAGESTGTANRGFDSWGRWDDATTSACSSSPESSLWWQDEATAHRLAKHLQPQLPISRSNPPPPPSPAQSPKPKDEPSKPSRWRLLKKGQEALQPSWTPPPSPARTEVAADEVSMTVRADEVSFRRENALGVWESMSGWGIVVRVRIRRRGGGRA